MFMTLDSSQDGFLTLDEVKKGLVTVLGEFKTFSSDWQVLIEQLDINEDGRIDYGEFISAAINKCRLLSNQNLESAFKLIDTNGDGLISCNELKEVFQGVHEFIQITLEDYDKLWAKIIQEVDTNCDNLISFQEFYDDMNAVLSHQSSVL
jgi:calcium-dependent protein kinase